MRLTCEEYRRDACALEAGSDTATKEEGEGSRTEEEDKIIPKQQIKQKSDAAVGTQPLGQHKYGPCIKCLLQPKSAFDWKKWKFEWVQEGAGLLLWLGCLPMGWRSIPSGTPSENTAISKKYAARRRDSGESPSHTNKHCFFGGQTYKTIPQQQNLDSQRPKP